jgi:hypothetical protein
MRCLTTADLIPADYRPAGIDQPLRSGLPNMIKVWNTDEFVLDPSRITIYIGATGIDGDTFKRSHLMDGYGVQINKTSRNTVLFMTTIGASRSSVAYLIEVLVTIARDLDTQISDSSPVERAAHERAVLRLTAPSAALPDFSGFHPAFADDGQSTPEGDVRRAFYLSYDDSFCEYLSPDEVQQRVDNGESVVSTTFVTPYPPGFPVLVPGQLFSDQIRSFMRSLDTPEVHGFRAGLGYRVYTAERPPAAVSRRPMERHLLSPQGQNDQDDDDDDHDGSNSDKNGSSLLCTERRRPSCPAWPALNIRGGPLRPPGGRSRPLRRAQACLCLPLPQQAALVLRQAAPDSLQGSGVQGVTKAVAAHRAGGADRLGAICLPEGGARSGDREEQVGVGGLAGGKRPPLRQGVGGSCHSGLVLVGVNRCVADLTSHFAPG